MPILADDVQVVIGVDTHKHTHTSTAVDAVTGAELATVTVSVNPAGYGQLVALADQFGGCRVWSIEGTRSYGAGLARFLADRGERVIEAEHPTRPVRRNGAKTDSIDALRCAREALTRSQWAEPRSGGRRNGLAVLVSARRSAVQSAADTLRQLLGLLHGTPEPIQARFRGLSSAQTVNRARGLRIDPRWDLETRTAATVLRDLARRVQTLRTEAAAHEHAINDIVTRWRPDLLDESGVGPITAATILCAWSHPGRFRNDAAFANLAGVAPLPASSGQTVRHRLNRHGDRHLNQALHVIVLTRLRVDPETQAYAQRRRAEGKTDREIRRCLKRFVARRLFHQLEQGAQTHP